MENARREGESAAQRRTGIRNDEVISVLKVAVFEAEDLPRLRFHP
jgi:hypothetical protein